MGKHEYVLEEMDLDFVPYVDMRELLDGPHALDWRAYQITFLDDQDYRELAPAGPTVLLVAYGRAGLSSGGNIVWTDEEGWPEHDYRIEPNYRAWLEHVLFGD